jgi:hypothetical protein
MRAGEQKAWNDMWHTPQAVQWERLGWTRTVARYCRAVVEAERTLKQDIMSEARQLEDRLGLTPKAMRLLLWTVVGDAVKEKREQRAQASPEDDPRNRIMAVD